MAEMHWRGAAETGGESGAPSGVTGPPLDFEGVGPRRGASSRPARAVRARPQSAGRPPCGLRPGRRPGPPQGLAAAPLWLGRPAPVRLYGAFSIGAPAVKPILLIEQEYSLRGLGLLGERLDASGLAYRRLRAWDERIDELAASDFA